MAKGIFRGLNEAELLNRRRLYLEAIDGLSVGDKAVSLSLGGKSFTYRPADIERLTMLLDEVNFALQILNPTAHGKRVTHTYPNFEVITPDLK